MCNLILPSKASFLIVDSHRPHEAVAYAELNGLGIVESGRLISKQKNLHKSAMSIVPSVHTRFIVGMVTHVKLLLLLFSKELVSIFLILTR
jgi:hypothetical protein